MHRDYWTEKERATEGEVTSCVTGLRALPRNYEPSQLFRIYFDSGCLQLYLC